MANPKAVSADKAQERKWRTEDDMRTLQRACEILDDKERMKAVEEAIEDAEEMLDTMKSYKKGLRRDDD